jgi:phospholipase C
MADPVPSSPQQIQHVVVLMLENRSFDHLLGALSLEGNNKIAGLTGKESNPADPRDPNSSAVKVTPSTQFGLPFGIGFDPAHEFPDVQMQLYGPQGTVPPVANPAKDPAPMNGFAFSGNMAVQAQNDDFPLESNQVMEYFPSAQIPVISTLAQNFAVFNWWFSSLPGPTWPNRYFIHAATSGGLNYSPSTLSSAADILGFGLEFKAGTIYDLLQKAGKQWRIYHDGIPQAATIASLYQNFNSQKATNFRDMSNFAADVAGNSLPDYTFIEPNYDVGGNYKNGNSMHPLNNVQSGESLIKLVYETLRNSSYWEKLLLVITFDEHGGFFDHVPPAPAVPTGDDSTYSDPKYPFNWDRLGVRVPNIVISAYTPQGTVIDTGSDGQPYVLDHTSVLKTVENLFGLPNLTNRDKNAKPLDPAFPLAAPIQTAPTKLPDPQPLTSLQLSAGQQAAFDNSSISSNQESFLELAHACNLRMSSSQEVFALNKKYWKIKLGRRQKDAAEYIREVERKIRHRRKPDHYLVPPSAETRKYKYRPPSADHPLLRSAKKAAPIANLPERVDLRYLCLPVRNQGAEGACSGFSTASFCEALHALSCGSLLPDYLAPAYIYARTRTQDGTFPQDSGASLADEFMVLQNFGICPEPFMPYTGNPAEPVAPKCDAAALPFRTQPIQVDRQIDVLKSVLASKKTISIGLMVFESFENPDSKGFVKLPEVSSEKFLGGHAVLLCGYDNASGCWIVRNQWGNQWGIGGYCYMPFGYETHWTEAWSA